MKAVVANCKVGKMLVDLLELKRIKASGNQNPRRGDPIDDAHAKFLYVVVGWLNEQGFDVI